MSFSSHLAATAGRLPARLRELVPPEQRADLRHRIGRYAPWEAGSDLAPPSHLSAERGGPPDFVGIGVQYAGSEWWYSLIADHPDVSHRDPIPAARHFLSHFSTAPFASSEIEQYHQWFPRVRGAVAGEWTPSYLDQPWVASLLALAAPDAKLLAIVRDPVERLRRSVAKRSPRRGEQIGWHLSDAVDRGFYARSLRPFYDHFEPERILVLQYERCRARPAEELAATYRFLGLDDAHRPDPSLLRRRSSPEAPAAFDRETSSRLVELYAADVAELVTLVPALDLSLWPSFADTEIGGEG